MKRNPTALVGLAALAVAAVLLSASSAQAQLRQTCKPFHALIQGALPTPNPFEPTDTWGGPIFGTLGGEFFQGGLSGNDGTANDGDKVMTFTGGRYKVCVASGPVWGGPGDCENSFTYEAQAVVIFPTADALGSYKAHAKIVEGTGRFASAWGNLVTGGPFILWPDADSPFGVYGRWNSEFSGRICGVQ